MQQRADETRRPSCERASARESSSSANRRASVVVSARARLAHTHTHTHAHGVYTHAHTDGEEIPTFVAWRGSSECGSVAFLSEDDDDDDGGGCGGDGRTVPSLSLLVLVQVIDTGASCCPCGW